MSDINLPKGYDPTARTYTCAECGGVFDREWSVEEASAEAVANGFSGIPAEHMVVVCDICYRAIVERNRDDPHSHFYQPRSNNA